MENPLVRPPWYQRTGGVLLVSFAVILGIGILGLAGLTAYYYRQIVSGQADTLAVRFNKNSVKTLGFTASRADNSRVESEEFDRSLIEDQTAPALGTDRPLVTVVEFIDFKCPNCQKAAPIVRQMLAKYGDKVRFISRNTPFESLHPGATRLAQITWCAGQQGRYWPLHDYLLVEQDAIPAEISPQFLETVSNRFGLDDVKFKQCLADQRSLVAVNKDYATAVSLGIRGTPTFFLNGQKIEGVIPLTAWDEILKSL